MGEGIVSLSRKVVFVRCEGKGAARLLLSQENAVRSLLEKDVVGLVGNVSDYPCISFSTVYYSHWWFLQLF